MIALNSTFRKNNSDYIGAIASTLCLIHCLATPFIFLAHSSVHHNHGHASPLWWKAFDVVFVCISFIAVFWSTRHSTNKNIKYALWASWFVLCFIIMNEHFSILAIPESAIYIPAIALVILHLYNKKYCQCNDESCCTSKL
ncbi:MAG: MerC domain-containing protein [Winogradskyella sp.]|uniref:MerC domain-containing protein n=1 Tax=Winogradskyella sp. TaxID=1883156 RepID=UPI000F40DC47|nr:MerC domain-containing protein [Winogradskyella sp.]RNC86397.1 MAG: MerC domain-containing protein [Winogradskyella sp.]